ncbi:hypothetical protein NECAME_05200 [Necator americanus]|uniref:UBA domain-containing protein n=1 Tax=Necator americanus TaxID=51031 RepID=W2SJ72_NECAM|nr:hypothetical protein NECAME_05200 [Necator americanus]ETN69618.1 hypothetical protein NECAME_05200 [Necator americanus]
MSYSNTYQDYLRDIPMEIGRRFYPPPIVNLPAIALPPPLNEIQYSFDAERRARQQFDEANSLPEIKPELPPRDFINGVSSTGSPTPSSISLINEVLQPCAPPPAPITSAQPLAPTVKPLSFEEFEGRGTVFDELEWRTIDDKLALSQILGNASLGSRPESAPVVNSTSNDQEIGLKPLHSLTNGAKPTTTAIPPYPVLDFGVRSKSEESTVALTSVGKLSTATFNKPVNSAPSSNAPHSAHHESPLRIRLLTKGYRENLVNVAMERLPRERLPHIEYYMKGMSILEKKGVDVADTVKFLLDSCLTDKQAVVQRAHTAEQLIGMGFTAEQVFPALLSSQGDRVKALDTLLGSR